MNHGGSDKARQVALEKYVYPAIQSGKDRLSISVRDLMKELQATGFPARNWPQVCTAIQAEKFLRANGLEIESVEGPPSKLSTTVVVHYRVAGSSAGVNPNPPSTNLESMEESPEEWAYRMTEKLRGLLKEELAAYGGGEAFLRWVRSEDEDTKENKDAA